MHAFNLADLFELTADAIPERPALVAGHVRLAYSQLDERATRFANALRSAGIGLGDRVAVLSGNRSEWLEVMLGCFKARAVPVNVNYRYTSDEVAYILDDSQAAAVVVESELVDRLGSLDRCSTRLVVTIDGPGTGLDYEQFLGAAPAQRAVSPRSGDDHYVLYTGGTTGQPKGVLWRHEDLFFAALRGGDLNDRPIRQPAQIVERLSLEPQPWLVTSPLMHGNGQWNSLLPLLTGRGVVLGTGRTFDASAIARLVHAEHPRLLVLVGDAMALPFLDAADSGSFDLTSVKVVASGGAMLAPATKERLQARLPDARIIDGFGASETGSSGTMVGVGPGALPRFEVGDDVTVLDEDLEPVAPGAVGRLARRGHVPLGYLNDPLKTATTFPTDRHGVRWAIPGDLARLEFDGAITLLGRGSACINTGGEKVHPDEVAHAIKAHPGVTDALVIGVPDERFGQAVAALVSCTEAEPDDDAIRSHLRTVIAGYKIPRRILRVHEIRYTAQGKPDLRWAEAALAEAAR